MRNLLTIGTIGALLLLTACRACEGDYYAMPPSNQVDTLPTITMTPPPAKGPDEGLIIIPGSISLGEHSKASKIIIEITIGKDSSYTYTIKTIGKGK